MPAQRGQDLQLCLLQLVQALKQAIGSAKPLVCVLLNGGALALGGDLPRRRALDANLVPDVEAYVRFQN